MEKFKNVLYSLYRHSNKNLSKFNNIHHNKSCYIVGDGASIKWFDLNSFNDKPLFVLSYLFFHRQFAELSNVKFGILSQPYYFYPYFRLPWPPHTLWKNNIQLKYRTFIKNNQDTNFFVNLSNYPVLRRSNVNYIFKSIPGDGFTEECVLKNQPPFYGSLRTAISLAIFMGFNDIVLIGCDYTHESVRSRHWYEKGPGVISKIENYNKDFFDIAKKYASITTITLGYENPYLPSVAYEEYTGKPLIYQENYQLVDDHNLRLLDTWPDYKIFNDE